MKVGRNAFAFNMSYGSLQKIGLKKKRRKGQLIKIDDIMGHPFFFIQSINRQPFKVQLNSSLLSAPDSFRPGNPYL